MTATDRPTRRVLARRWWRRARRVLDGARGLRWRATARWVISTRRPASGVPESSSFNWVTASETTNTTVWIHNYWSDGYGIPTPEIHATLLDESGTSLVTWSLTLAPDATVPIDVRSVCRTNGVALPFEGQLLLRMRHEKLVP